MKIISLIIIIEISKARQKEWLSLCSMKDYWIRERKKNYAHKVIPK